jgi:hypothetical protein
MVHVLMGEENWERRRSLKGCMVRQAKGSVKYNGQNWDKCLWEL